MPRSLRSFLAVLAGLIVIMVTVIACNLLSAHALRHALRVVPGHPTPGYLALNAAYSLLAAAAGGWLAARLSSFKPLHHALALAMLLAVFGLAMLITPSAAQPWSYQLLMAVVPPFAVVAGGWFAARAAAQA